MIQSQYKVRLGELLVDAKVVSSADLTEAIQVSKRLGIPIGRVLLESGCVSATVLEAALEGQPLVNDGDKSKEEIVKVLREVHTTGNSLNELMTDLPSRNGRNSDRLAELLLDSEIVSQDQLDQALITSFESGIPLGSALVFEGILSPSLFPSILQIHRNIRDGKISKEEAVKEIKSTFLHWLKAAESLSRQDNNLKARIQTQKQIEDDIETYLVESQAASKTTRPTAAARLELTVKLEPQDTLKFGDFLIDSGCFKASDIQSAFDQAADDPEKIARVYLALGLIEKQTLDTALRSYNLVLRQRLSTEEAVQAVKASSNGHIEYSDKRIKRYFDKNWRKQAKSKVVGGLVLGATLAGFSFMKRSKRR